MVRYIKIDSDFYELKFDKESEVMIKLALSSKPTVQLFKDFCKSFGVNYELKKVSRYCPHSQIMYEAVFKN